MPVYVYKCRTCKETFEKRHGMFYEQDRCIHCMSDDIFKVPTIQARNKTDKTSSSTAGKIVDKYIQDAKEEIKKEKRKLSSEEF